MSKQKTLTAGRPSATKSKVATLASLADETEMKRVNFQLSAELHTKLKVYAASHGKSITEILTEHVVKLANA
ncbi:MAG: plasmid partition protein ParG [Plesiomonas sp.]